MNCNDCFREELSIGDFVIHDTHSLEGAISGYVLDIKGDFLLIEKIEDDEHHRCYGRDVFKMDRY